MRIQKQGEPLEEGDPRNTVEMIKTRASQNRRSVPHTAAYWDLKDLKDSGRGQLGPSEMRKAPGKKKRHSSKRSGHTKRPEPFSRDDIAFHLKEGSSRGKRTGRES